MVTQEFTLEALNKALEEGPYGKCVFNNDNNVVDHQVVNFTLEDGATIGFTMSAFPSRPGRTMLIMGIKGNIEASMEENIINVEIFGKPAEVIDVKKLTDDFFGHGGGDGRMISSLIKYIRTGEVAPGITTIDRSVESHYVAMAAEKSRTEGGKVVDMKEYIKEISL